MKILAIVHEIFLSFKKILYLTAYMLLPFYSGHIMQLIMLENLRVKLSYGTWLETFAVSDYTSTL